MENKKRKNNLSAQIAMDSALGKLSSTKGVKTSGDTSTVKGTKSAGKAATVKGFDDTPASPGPSVNNNKWRTEYKDTLNKEGKMEKLDRPSTSSVDTSSAINSVDESLKKLKKKKD